MLGTSLSGVFISPEWPELSPLGAVNQMCLSLQSISPALALYAVRHLYNPFK